jgi:hypothetical protein
MNRLHFMKSRTGERAAACRELVEGLNLSPEQRQGLLDELVSDQRPFFEQHLAWTLVRFRP